MNLFQGWRRQGASGDVPVFIDKIQKTLSFLNTQLSHELRIGLTTAVFFHFDSVEISVITQVVQKSLFFFDAGF